MAITAIPAAGTSGPAVVAAVVVPAVPVVRDVLAPAVVGVALAAVEVLDAVVFAGGMYVGGGVAKTGVCTEIAPVASGVIGCGVSVPVGMVPGTANAIT